MKYALASALAFLLGCNSLGINAETPREKYFAVVASYIAAEEQATLYCETPSTPRSHCEDILEVAERAQEARATVRASIAAGVAEDSTFVGASAALRVLLIEVAAIAARGN